MRAFKLRAVDRKNLINERLHLPHGRYPHCLSRVPLLIVSYQRRDFSYSSPDFRSSATRGGDSNRDEINARFFIMSSERGDSSLQIGLADSVLCSIRFEQI